MTAQHSRINGSEFMMEWWTPERLHTLGDYTMLVMVLGLCAYVAFVQRALERAVSTCEARMRLLIGATKDAERASERYDKLSRWYLAACCEMKAKDPQWCPPDRRGL
jgi:hypothetical protein